MRSIVDGMARLALLVGLLLLATRGREGTPVLEDGDGVLEETIDEDVEEDQEMPLLDALENDPLQIWIPPNVYPGSLTKANVEKKRNRIPLAWKGMKGEEKPDNQKISLRSLQMFFTRMKPKLSERLKQLKMFSTVREQIG